ncbi:hypothetical protein QVD17_00565 [Tagetes erecta]|uniref:Uncharacterized protein n=1 Tax=Tagetes erecta TaxID=13708 RepID=A0AAD8L907_TARER|nr:hypothetical protein QVD17_00565 [Tagetes erecta]
MFLNLTKVKRHNRRGRNTQRRAIMSIKAQRRSGKDAMSSFANKHTNKPLFLSLMINHVYTSSSSSSSSQGFSYVCDPVALG